MEGIQSLMQTIYCNALLVLQLMRFFTISPSERVPEEVVKFQNYTTLAESWAFSVGSTEYKFQELSG